MKPEIKNDIKKRKLKVREDWICGYEEREVQDAQHCEAREKVSISLA